MNVAIVGCGAMGSIYAGLLAEAGNNVLAIGKAGEHIDAIRTAGLRLEGALGHSEIEKWRCYDAASIFTGFTRCQTSTMTIGVTIFRRCRSRCRTGRNTQSAWQLDVWVEEDALDQWQSV